MEAKYPEITLGETVCVKLKTIYFDDKNWPECHKIIAKKFTDLKFIAKKFYAGKDDLEILKELAKYSTKDIEEVFHMELKRT